MVELSGRKASYFPFWNEASLGRYQCTVKCGCGWIILKVIYKGRKRSNLAHFSLGGNFLKNCLIPFFYFGLKLPRKGADRLPKDGFDWIALNVICQDLKGQKKVKFGYFATFWPFYQKRFDKFLYFMYTASWGWYWSTGKRGNWLIHFKVHFQGRKGQD